MTNPSYCDWQRSTATRITDLDSVLENQKGEFSSLQTRAAGAAAKHQRISALRRDWRALYPTARRALRTLAARRTGLRFIYQKDYFAKILALDDILANVKFSGGGLEFKLLPPSTLLMVPDPSVPCDAFLMDQIGVSVPFTVTLYGEGYTGELALSLGVACGQSQMKLYLARRPRLRNSQLPDSILPFLAGRIEAQAKSELAKHGLKFGDVNSLPSQQVRLEFLAAQTGTSAIAVNAAALPATAGVPRPQGTYPEAEVTIEDWADTETRIIPSVLFTMLRQYVREHIAKGPLRFDEEETAIVPVPPFYTPNPVRSKNALRFSGSVWCINEFGDREDYGTHELYAALAWSGAAVGPATDVDVYFDLLGSGRIFIFPQSLGRQTLITLKNAAWVETSISQDIVAIAVKYRPPANG